METRSAEGAELHLADYLERGGARPTVLDRLQSVFELRSAQRESRSGKSKGRPPSASRRPSPTASASFAAAAIPRTISRPCWPTDRANSSGKPRIASTFPRCWRATDTCSACSMRAWPFVGKATRARRRWKKRLGGEFSASPVLVGDMIYATSETGETFVYRADPSKFEQIAVNKLGDEAMASPTICGSRIYLHVGRASRRPAARNAVLPGESEVIPGGLQPADDFFKLQRSPVRRLPEWRWLKSPFSQRALLGFMGVSILSSADESTDSI